MFTFAAFLGASMNTAPSGWIGGIGVSAGYLRALVLAGRRINAILGAFAPQYRHPSCAGRINAAVVGLLLAALYQPVWTSAIFQPQDFGLALVALVALMFWKLPPWLVVLGSGCSWVAVERRSVRHKK
ncbi:hypothetical protein [Escherichia coli]|uniref:hypothetical protein n=1 Tax=Escherichia coli TaxID=562 RepID=UPI003D9C9EAB